MRTLFASTLFVSAALLFVVQPLVARLVLPLLGGTPAVWNTCMVFFQAVLLAGYAYAHAAPARLGVRRHAAVHLLVLLVPWLVLPVALPSGWPPPDSTAPVAWLLGLLAAAVGLPFFAVATSGPLLQRWFASTGDPAARDPYFLYAASNLGSLVGLFAYPFLLEPTLTLGDQGRLWAGGYAAFVALTAACAVALWRAPAAKTADAPRPEAPAPPLAWPRRLRWLLLAFVPSSLMLSVTTYLTTDIAAIPLLWVVPLALYLLTFVLAFGRRHPEGGAVPGVARRGPPRPETLPEGGAVDEAGLPADRPAGRPQGVARRGPTRPRTTIVRPAWLARWLPLVVLLVVLALLSEATEPAGVLIPLHLVALFWVGLFCHGTLAEDRPDARRLTEFYLWLSAGGVLGGLFNALVAPVLFRGVVEYPLVLVLACALRPGLAPAARRFGPRVRDVALPVLLGLVTAALVVGLQAGGLPPGPVSVALMFGAPLVVCYTFLARPARFALGVAALLLAGGLYRGVHGESAYRARSFFGAHRVTLDPTHSFRVLVHGNTVHGRQSLDPAQRRRPLSYYSRRGPIGRVIALMEKEGRLHRVGVIGLGAGALACYARPGQRWTFYEIDPVVVTIARDTGLFTYLRDMPEEPEIVLGDGRLQLARSSERYDLLVIDAFSSDAVPVHLLTREALAVYRAHLAEGGVMAFHVSNRYLNLQGVLGDLAADARPSLVCWSLEDRGLVGPERQEGKDPSHWVMLMEQSTSLALLGHGPWEKVERRPDHRVWTDDFSNLLGVLRWDKKGE
jgi:hypothetical protein